MRAPALPKMILTHAALMLACMIVLYPVLWVIKMALSPGQGFALSASPLPQTVTA